MLKKKRQKIDLLSFWPFRPFRPFLAEKPNKLGQDTSEKQNHPRKELFVTVKAFIYSEHVGV